jgi:hypothetical protein
MATNLPPVMVLNSSSPENPVDEDTESVSSAEFLFSFQLQNGFLDPVLSDMY